MGAAGRDFHDFNVVYRELDTHRVVAFTAAQIPNIAGRRYPPELAGSRYPNGIPIYPEGDLPDLIRALDVTHVAFAYSDISHADVMHKASAVLAAGASFELIGPSRTMLSSRVPVLSVCAVRTGAGKSPFVRRAVEVIKAAGSRPCVVRHPMPYGDLRSQVAQRFATAEDLTRQHCTIEEREEYEPHVQAGTTVLAGVDYSRVLGLAEAEADLIIWDGGNNDFPFFRPSLQVVIADALRPGHEMLFHPGETNVRMAQALIINKVDVADRTAVEEVRRNLAYLNPRATVTEGKLAVRTDDPEAVRGKRVLVIEDGPTTTHGGMPTGAGYQAAMQLECTPVDPRDSAVGTLAAAFTEYPHIGPVLPALGYGDEQLSDLEATINAVPCDAVLIASPVDLRSLIEIRRPTVRVSYDFECVAGPTLDEILAPLSEGT